MITDRLTPEALDALLLAHHDRDVPLKLAEVCFDCLEPWPCTIYLLASEARDARPVIAASRKVNIQFMKSECAGVPTRWTLTVDGVEQLHEALAHYEEGTK